MGELLVIEPLELKFPIELNKQISCSLHLSNKTDRYVAFKVFTTNPKIYCVRPNIGVVLPRSTCDVKVTMKALKEAPPDMQCPDKFLIRSAKIDYIFKKEAGLQVEECKFRVVYVSPPTPPSPVQEGGSPVGIICDCMKHQLPVKSSAKLPNSKISNSSPGNLLQPATVENGREGGDVSDSNKQKSQQASKGFVRGFKPNDETSMTTPLIPKPTKEKNIAIKLNNWLRGMWRTACRRSRTRTTHVEAGA